MSKSLVEKLSKIQKSLKAPKSQYNSFGKYAYRNQEDILEAVKPLLAEHGLVQTISDTIIEVAGRVYVNAMVTVTDGESSITNQASAREPLEQKGMNEAQITGSASSYARKYALNGMYAIDDTKDADATNTHGKEDKKEPPKQETPKETKEPTKEKPAETNSRFKPKGADKPKETKTESTGDGGWE
jgi:hypothetical protein